MLKPSIKTGPAPYSTNYCPSYLKSVKDYGTSRQELWTIGAKRAPTKTWAEFGVGIGASARGLASRLYEDGSLYLFDSWEGIPEQWVLGDTLTEPVGQWAFPRLKTYDPRVMIVDGWFEKTLPYKFPEQLGLVHIDCDIYSSTRSVLFGCDEYIKEGTVLIFDEYYGYQNYREHEYKACEEWMAATGILSSGLVVQHLKQ